MAIMMTIMTMMMMTIMMILKMLMTKNSNEMGKQL